MSQLRSVFATSFRSDDRRPGRGPGVSWGSSTLLDRILDLLTIFRRPIPVPVKARRPLR